MTKSQIALATLLSFTIFSVQADWENTAKISPEGIFGEKCGMCHRAMGMGSVILGRRYEGAQALLENRDNLSGQFIRTVVRQGYNNMFPLSRGEVSDEQLEMIIKHLTKAEEGVL